MDRWRETDGTRAWWFWRLQLLLTDLNSIVLDAETSCVLFMFAQHFNFQILHVYNQEEDLSLFVLDSHVFPHFWAGLFLYEWREEIFLLNRCLYLKHRVVLLAEVLLTIAKSSAISLHSIIRVSHEYQLFTDNLRGSSELTSWSSSNHNVHSYLDWYHMTLVMSCSTQGMM